MKFKKFMDKHFGFWNGFFSVFGGNDMDEFENDLRGLEFEYTVPKRKELNEQFQQWSTNEVWVEGIPLPLVKEKGMSPEEESRRLQKEHKRIEERLVELDQEMEKK